jgi:hypothetical protein
MLYNSQIFCENWVIVVLTWCYEDLIEFSNIVLELVRTDQDIKIFNFLDSPSC